MGEAEPELGRLIADFNALFNDKIASVFAPPPEEKALLTKSQVLTLMRVWRQPGQTATMLGESLGMTKANLTLILDELEAHGLVRRELDPADRRKARVYPLEAGKTRAEAIARRLDGLFAEKLAPLSQAEKRELAEHLEALAGLLSKL
jgi:DNA-binding MarR family transcriptional regulator